MPQTIASEVNWDAYAENVGMRLDLSHVIALEFILREDPIKGAKKLLLDAGCGDGKYTAFLANLGQTIAADASFVQVSRVLKEGYPAVQCDLNHPPFKNNTFSFIFSNQVLEHVDIPEKFIAALYSILNTDGTLVLSTPNRLAPSRFIDFSFLHRLDKTHKREYDLVAAKRLIGKLSGLKGCQVKLRGYSSIGRGRIKFFWWKLLPARPRKALLNFIYNQPVFARGFIFLVKKVD